MNKETVNLTFRVDQLPVMSKTSILWNRMRAGDVGQGSKDGELIFYMPGYVSRWVIAKAVQVTGGWVIVEHDWMNGKVQGVKFTEELPS